MGGVVKSIGRAVKGVVKGVSKVIGGVVSAVTSPFGASTDVPDYDIGQDQTQAIQGVLLNQEGAVREIPIIYGERQVVAPGCSHQPMAQTTSTFTWLWCSVKVSATR